MKGHFQTSLVTTVGLRQSVKKSFSFLVLSEQTTLQNVLALKEDHGLLWTSQTAE